VRNNTSIGGSAPAAGFAVAVKVYANCSPVIEHNAMSGGSSAGKNYAVLVAGDSEATIRYNTVNGGFSGICRGVLVYEAQATIDYNTIDGGQGTDTYGVQTGGDSRVWVRRNIIRGGTASGRSGGILLISENAVIEGNTISAGQSNTWGSYGVHIVTVDVFNLRNNLISGGQTGGTGGASGVFCDASNGRIFNNTIAGGIGGRAPGIAMINGSAPSIENNIIFALSSSEGFCVYEEDTNTDFAASIRNNALWDNSGSTILYRTWDGQNLDNLAVIEVLSHASGNWDEDPDFVDIDGVDGDITTIEDNDWHLTADSPAETRQGGRDGAARAWGYSTDKDDATRTNLTQGPDDNPANLDAEGWSMGAYEQD
jgi:hypothetical protein